MAESVGEIKLDLSLDDKLDKEVNSSIKNVNQRMLSCFDGLRGKVNSFGKEISNSLMGVSSKTVELNEKLQETADKISKVEEELKGLQNAPISSKSMEKLEDSIKSTEKEIGELYL